MSLLLGDCLQDSKGIDAFRTQWVGPIAPGKDAFSCWKALVSIPEQVSK